jgi:hypothetical protein
VLGVWEIALDVWALITGGGTADLPSDALRVTIMDILSSSVSLALGPKLFGNSSPSSNHSPWGRSGVCG